ncbi:MAG: type II secretion system protein J [Acidobacteriota bacterium]
MKPRPNASAGFTLIEVLLALLIAALVMLGAYSVTSQVMAMSEDAQISLATEDAMDILRLTLANDLGSIIWTETNKKDAAQAVAFYGGPDTTALSGATDTLLFSLATAATLDPAAAFPSYAFNRVEYVLRGITEGENAGKDRRSLVRREIPLGTLTWRDRERTAVAETVLLDAVENCAVTFLENAANSPLKSWDSSARKLARLSPLPAQVRLGGTAIFSGKRRTVDVRVPLPPQDISLSVRQ